MPDDEEEDRVARQARMISGVGGMLAAMMAIWLDPGMVEEGRLPPRFMTGTLVLWTGAAVLLAAAILGLQFIISGEASLFWLLPALTMFLPLAMAFFSEPPNRSLGLGVGAAAGTASGGAVALVGSSVLTLHLALFLGLSAAALVAAFTFGRLTREHPPPPTESPTN